MSIPDSATIVDGRLRVELRPASEFHPERATITPTYPDASWAVRATGPGRTRPAEIKWSGGGTATPSDARTLARALRLAAAYLPHLDPTVGVSPSREDG